MMEKRGESPLPISSCCLTYPLQLMGHAHPARRPEHGLLMRIALGQPSSLHHLRRLRSRLRGRGCAVVRRLRRYYTAVRLPVSVHHGLASLDFPMRPVVPSVTGEHGISRFSREVFLCMQRVFDRAGFPYLSPWRGVGYGLPLTGTASAPRIIVISRLHSSPAHTPVNASRPPLRATAHDLGSV
jgi:hypothetical protein